MVKNKKDAFIYNAVINDYLGLKEDVGDRVDILFNYNKIYILDLTEEHNMFLNSITNFNFSNYIDDSNTLFMFLVEHVIVYDLPEYIETEEIAIQAEMFSRYHFSNYEDDAVYDFIYQEIDLYDRLKRMIIKYMLDNKVTKQTVMPHTWYFGTGRIQDIKLSIVRKE